MKRTIQRGISLLALFAIGYFSQAQRLAATSSTLRESSLDEPLLANKSISYPNPFKTTSTIEFSNEKSIAKIQVINSAGIVVFKTEAIGSFTFGNDLAAGIYLITIEFGNKTETIKVIKE